MNTPFASKDGKLVDVSGLTLAIGAKGRQIVHDVSFSVSPGEFVGLVGESGRDRKSVV